MPSEWRETTLDDIAVFRNGKALSPEFYIPDALHPVYGSNGQIARTNEVLHNEPVVVIGRVGAFCGCVQAAYEPSWVTDNAVVATAREGVDFRFLYYKLLALDLRHTAIGSAQPLVTQGGLKVVHTLKPPAEEQKAIGRILGALDDKIELNRKMNETLEQTARAVFKSWFVDFEPFRDKGMVDSPLGEIPQGWKVASVGQHMRNFDSQRVPVSGEERAKRLGPYPYHGAAGVMDYVDDYLFDGIYLLVGEDGPVVHDNGIAVAQYVWGKLWVNNHAHVLQGAGGVSTEQLYLYFQYEPVAAYVTGAVQPKLSQGRMNLMPFVFAGDAVCQSFAMKVQPLFARLRANADESRTLAAIRDALLPKLMSGEIKASGCSAN